jgi:hypothetical protein
MTVLKRQKLRGLNKGHLCTLGQGVSNGQCLVLLRGQQRIRFSHPNIDVAEVQLRVLGFFC